MQSNIIQKKENKLLDIIKYISAILILASHCLPLIPNDSFNFLYGQWFFRFCVPLFIISSGYFFASFDRNGKVKYIKRIAVLYVVASLLYLPTYIGADHKTIVNTLALGYHHLWYLSALTISLCLLCVLEYIPAVKKVFNKIYPYIAVILIFVGAFYDEYKNVFADLYNVPIIKSFGEAIGYIGGSRHALFFVLPMVLIGGFIFEQKDKIKLQKTGCILLTVVSFGISLAECLMLRRFGGDSITCDVTLTNFLPAIFLFVLTRKWSPQALQNIQTKALRKHADTLYILHVLVLLVIDRLFSVTYIYRFLLILIMSMVLSWLYTKAMDLIKITQKKNKKA